MFKLVWICIFAAMAAGIYASVHMAIADLLFLEDTPHSISAAVAMEPGNAEYHALLAEHDESADASPEPQLLLAASLSPMNSAFPVRAALRAEAGHNYVKAENLLLHAAEIDRKFLPRWALLNFYFRRGSESGVWPAGFWPSMKMALEISSPEDTDAVFHLAWEQTQDAKSILDHLQPGKATLQRYLGFLLGSDRVDAAGPVALRLVPAADPADLPVLLNYCDRAIPSNSKSAVAVWNLLAGRKLIAETILNPSKGAILTNKDFASTPLPRGFDWQVPSVDGAFVSQASDGHGISVHFDGTEPEDCMLLSQTMPVISGAHYRIDYEYSAFGHPLRGLLWEAISHGRVLAASTELNSESDRAPGQIAFVAEHDSVQLALRYRRPAGSVRAEGTIVIHQLSDHVVL